MCMRPHEEDHRRAEDQRLVARVGFSPWTNLAHLGGTAAIIIALVTLGGDLYSTQQGLVDQTNRNTNDGAEFRKRISGVERDVSALEVRATYNRQQIDRVEERSASDRKIIINRLERVDKKLDRLIEARN